MSLISVVRSFESSAMKISQFASLTTVALVVALSSAASAQQDLAPTIASVSVQCVFPQLSSPPQTTVRVTLKPILSPEPDPLVYEFRNVSTGQIVSVMPGETATPPDFHLPPGTYDLSLKRRLSPHSRSVWVDIVAPASVRTNAAGAGCRLLTQPATPPGGPLPEVIRGGRIVGP